jgi:hypothetical protein
MSLANNPYVKAELDNLERQFGFKALLTLDDYCALFNTGRKMATRHMKRRGVPRLKIGHDIFIPIHEMALFLARKKAWTEGKIVFAHTAHNLPKNSRGFSKQAHLKQLLGDDYILNGKADL